MSNVLNYRPPPTANRLLQSRAFIQGIVGPIGSGKSVACVMRLLANAAKQPPSPTDGLRRSRYAIVRNTYRMLRDTTVKTVHEWLPPGPAGVWRDAAMTYTVRFGDVETELLFRALDGPDDMRNLLSLDLTGAWLNEYRELPPEVLMNLLGRIGRYPRRTPTTGGAVERFIVADSNPPPQGSFWHEFFELPPSEEVVRALRESLPPNSPEADRPIIEYFRQPGGRSPNAENLENLPDGYYALLVAANAHRGEEWIRVHVDAEYGQDPSNTPVYPEYRASLHAPNPPPKPIPGVPLVAGMDFGLTPALVVCQQAPSGQWRVLKEYVARNSGIERFIEALMPRLRADFPDHPLHQLTIYADPAGQHRSQADERTCFAVLRSRGFTVVPGPSSPTVRLGAVRRCLTRLIDGQPGLVVDATQCPVLHAGFVGGYAYAHTREGELQPQPKKTAHSHPHDALQHLLGHFEGPAMVSGSDDPRKPVRPKLPRKDPLAWSVYDA